MEQIRNTYQLEKFLDDTDLYLYQRILEVIERDMENINPELLDKLGELHMNLSRVVLRGKQHDLFRENYNRRLMNECTSTLSQLIQYTTIEHIKQ